MFRFANTNLNFTEDGDFMNGYSHMAVGFSTGWFLTGGDPFYSTVVAGGSLLVDLDCSTSLIGRYNPFAYSNLMRHRGHCHTAIGSVMLSLPFMIFGYTAFYLILAGCISHLLADKLYSTWPHKSRFSLKLW